MLDYLMFKCNIMNNDNIYYIITVVRNLLHSHKYCRLRCGKYWNYSEHFFFFLSMRPCILIPKQTAVGRSNNKMLLFESCSWSIWYNIINYNIPIQSKYFHPRRWYLFCLQFYTVLFQQCICIIWLIFFFQLFIKHYTFILVCINRLRVFGNL